MRWSDVTGAQACQGRTPNNQTAAPGSTFNTTKGAIDSLGTNNNSCSFNGPNLPPTMTTQYGTSPGMHGGTTALNALPPTVLDSFVVSSGCDPNIYGDEGTLGPPPLYTYDESNTIGAGLYNNTFLSTGHSSTLPSAWLTNDVLFSGGGGGCVGGMLGGLVGGLIGCALGGQQGAQLGGMLGGAAGSSFLGSGRNNGGYGGYGGGGYGGGGYGGGGYGGGGYGGGGGGSFGVSGTFGF